MDEKPKRLTGLSLTDFLGSLRITRVEPVGRSSASGERSGEAELEKLLEKGDALSPGPGKLTEDADTLERLFAAAGESACFGLTPDGHLDSHQPLVFDPHKAAEQVIRLLDADIAGEDRDEALASTWLGLAYHDHDHPADFGGLVREAGADGKPKCCYVDVKGTKALTPSRQRSKLEERAQQRKFGTLAQTVTRAANNGFAGYPGRGKPGLMVTLLHNPVMEGKTHSGYGMGWFFDIRSNYQASTAVWGWGGALGVKLPEELQKRLESSQAMVQGRTTNLLELLREYRDYGQFRNAEGEWDRERLRSTLLAMYIAARYLLMREDPELHADESVENLQPAGVETPLSPEDFHPGESWGTYFGHKADEATAKWRKSEDEKREIQRKADEEKREIQRKADEEKRFFLEEKRKADEAQRLALEEKRKADEEKRFFLEEKRKADEAQRLALEEKRKAEEAQRLALEEKRKANETFRAMIARRRQRGDSDTVIAADLGFTVQELLERFPAQT